MINLFLPERRAADIHNRDPISGFWYGPVGRAVSSGVHVTDDVAMTYSAVWAATRLLAGTGGWLPFGLYRRLDNGGREIATQDPRHILVHDRPNPEMTAMMYRAMGIGFQVNRGNFYAEIQRETGMDRRPVAYWPIHSSRVTVLRDAETDELVYKVANNRGEPSFIPARDMLHVPSMISDDGIIGKGVIQHARESIGFGIATERHGANWFGKGAVPRIVINHTGKMDTEARAEFRKEWAEIYGGPDGSKVALLGADATVTPISVSAEDSQFLFTRQHNVEEIARWYGVPPHMLQHLLRSTHNNIEHQGIEFVVYSLIPWLKLWEQEYWAKTLTEEEKPNHFYEFNVTALLRGDAAARGNFYKSMVNTGLMSRNEARKLENLNPVEGGDTMLVQGAMVGLNDEGRPEPPATAQVSPLPKVSDDSQMQALASALQQLSESHINLQQKIEQLGAARLTDGRDVALRAAAVEMLEDALSRMITKECKAASRAANNPGEFVQWVESFYAKHADILADAVKPALKAMRVFGAVQLTARDFADSFVADSKAAMLAVAQDSKTDTLAANVAALVKRWEKERASEVSQNVMAA